MHVYLDALNILAVAATKLIHPGSADPVSRFIGVFSQSCHSFKSTGRLAELSTVSRCQSEFLSKTLEVESDLRCRSAGETMKLFQPAHRQIRFRHAQVLFPDGDHVEGVERVAEEPSATLILLLWNFDPRFFFPSRRSLSL